MTQGSSASFSSSQKNSSVGGAESGRHSVLVRRMSVISGGHRIRETIHSGHFMVSDFEPESEAQDEEYEVGMPIPPGPDETVVVKSPQAPTQAQGPVSVGSVSSGHDVRTVTGRQREAGPSTPRMMDPFDPLSFRPTFGGGSRGGSSGVGEMATTIPSSFSFGGEGGDALSLVPSTQAEAPATAISIDGSLTKLFQCMSLAYRQKLTSPKWNRFKGVRLRWKDKIRLNNVIWRCWHMQFIMKKKTLVCQFASPLDTDGHNKPEAVVMEGKYWKRKLSTVAAEYKKWRLFYRNRIMGWTHNTPTPDLHPVSLDGFDWSRSGTFGGMSNIIFDDDLLMDFTDTLFSSLSSNQPFAFPNPREIARAGMVADFIQPGLVQLQPNLEDFMDTLEPLQDYVNSKLLPPVPEELEAFDPPDSLLSEEVLTPIHHKAPDHLAMNKGNNHNNRSPLDSSAYAPNNNSQTQQQQQQQHNFYGQEGLGSTVKSSAPSLLLKEGGVTPSHGNRASSSSRGQQHGGYSTGGGGRQGQEIFAKPQGKPRGRSRSGGGSTRGACHIAPAPPANHQALNQQQQHLQQIMGNNNAGAPSSTLLNSSTLLSHLLTNTHHAGGQQQQQLNHYALDKVGPSMGGGGVHSVVSGGMRGSATPLNMIMGSTGQHGTQGQHIQQQQQQQLIQSQGPWNSKSPLETLPPNLTLNFGLSGTKGNNVIGLSGMGTVLTGQQGMSSGGGGSGGGSPTQLAGAPSPPMGPPISGPSSPAKPFRAKGESTERVQYKQEHRRVCHINAEQKRRCNIKNGFDTLHSLIPQLSHNPNAKVSKAAMLHKGAEYIRQLKLERAQLKEEIEAHRAEVDALNSAINNCQSMLPATGAPVSRQRTNKMKEMFDHWVRLRTHDNWKFWIFSTLIRPLLDSYNASVSTASVDELCRTVLTWVDQHCSLVDLRPVVLTSLRYLCTSTDVLNNPQNLAEEAYKAVNNPTPDRDNKGDSR